MNKRLTQLGVILALMLAIISNPAYSRSGELNAKSKSIIQRNIGNFDETKAANLGFAVVPDANIAPTAQFFGQITIAGNIFSSGTFDNTPAVDVAGRIRVSTADAGKVGEILVVADYNGAWFMKTPVGWLPWDLQLMHLTASQPAAALAIIENIDIVSQLDLLGHFNIYIGYRLNEVVKYSPTPLTFTRGMLEVEPVPVLAMAVATGKLNDTGITTCANNTTNGLTCPQTTHLGQDAESGRDVTHNDPSDGHAGFSFTKVSAKGMVLPATATRWNCVKDNVTGLIWEVKTDDNGLHDKDWSYTWFDTDNTRNGGDDGTHTPPSASCGSTSDCDTQGYVQAVNAVGWCGANDWRMPTRGELRGLVALDRTNPAIDTAYFPDTLSDLFYWSSSAYTGIKVSAWLVRFNVGSNDWNGKWIRFKVRLVRRGQ